jgi:hypothetical protein
MSRSKIIEIATKEIGTREEELSIKRPKHNHYSAWFYNDGTEYMDDSPWCATFVSWVYDQSSHPLGVIDHKRGFSGVSNGYKHWKKTRELIITPDIAKRRYNNKDLSTHKEKYYHWLKTGEMIGDPKEGDIVLYKFGHSLNVDHTGIFYKWAEYGKSFYSIDGNTAIFKKIKKTNKVVLSYPFVLIERASNSPINNFDERNGGYVVMKRRDIKYVEAFVSIKELRLPNDSNDFLMGNNGLTWDEVDINYGDRNLNPLPFTRT